MFDVQTLRVFQRLGLGDYDSQQYYPGNIDT